MKLDRTKPESWPFMLSRTDVKEILGVSNNKVLEIFHRQDFPRIYVGKRLLISKPSFLDYISKQSNRNQHQ